VRFTGSVLNLSGNSSVKSSQIEAFQRPNATDLNISIEEEKPLPGLAGKVGPGLLNLPELNQSADADEEAEGQDEPPEPFIVVPDEVGGALHDERPLGEAEPEAGERAVTRSDSVTEAHKEHESNPVEEEGGEEGREEHKVVSK